jgi:hypothetical protein
MALPRAVACEVADKRLCADLSRDGRLTSRRRLRVTGLSADVAASYVRDRGINRTPIARDRMGAVCPDSMRKGYLRCRLRWQLAFAPPMPQHALKRLFGDASTRKALFIIILR